MREKIPAVMRRGATLAVALCAPALAHASFLSGDTLDTAANILSWFIIIVMPFVAIGIFLFVHVLPEKIAEKRQHPQKDSIKVLCILSLFFGGMLWPFAWLWAYTRPTLHKSVFGTEKHEDYYVEMDEKFHAGQLSQDELAQLRSELHVMASKGHISAPLRKLLSELDALESGEVPTVTASAPPPAPVARKAAAAHEGDD